MLRFIFVSLFLSFIVYLIFRFIGGFIKFMGGGDSRRNTTGFNSAATQPQKDKKKINPEDIVEADFEEIEISEEKNK